ncbi:hypothetical protein B0H11DRAFT_2244932 [Mycena galericulata]|nr:hypothetical protein B0H11DRAFT_2244932 [Mycena galericulata]
MAPTRICQTLLHLLPHWQIPTVQLAQIKNPPQQWSTRLATTNSRPHALIAGDEDETHRVGDPFFLFSPIADLVDATTTMTQPAQQDRPGAEAHNSEFRGLARERER